ncbi:MAG: hypothetical protein PHV33_07380 [Elusimicrobiales bacterium]|nr:hypothetical protein [Elusimicrobiales bacterium]
MKLLAAILMILASAQSVLGGDFGSGAKGTTGAAFLTMGMGARAVGMGGAYSAVAADASAVSIDSNLIVHKSDSKAGLQGFLFARGLLSKLIGLCQTVHYN